MKIYLMMTLFIIIEYVDDNISFYIEKRKKSKNKI